jgi:hypothetical protein
MTRWNDRWNGWWLASDVAALACTCLAWILLAVLIDPRGDFPLDDDWGYGLPVKALVEHGTIRFTEWTCPSLIAQVGWGGLFCLPGGFSFTALRISTLTLGLVALLGMYLLMRRVGANPATALLGTWVLGANPIFLGLAYTFMTDVPFLALMNLSLLFLIRGLDGGRDGAVWAGLLVALVAMFVRQIALGIFVGFMLAYPFTRGFTRKWLIQAVLPTIVAAAALKLYEEALKAAELLPLNYYQYNMALATAVDHLVHFKLGVVRHALYRACKILFYIGLVGSPFALGLWPSWLARQQPRSRAVHLAWVGAATALVTAVLAATANLIPLLDPGSFLLDLGIGVRTMRGGWPPGAPRAIWVGVTALAVLGTILAVRALVAAIDSIARSFGDPDANAAARRGRVVLLVVTALFYAGPLTFAYMGLYDRYILVWIPLALLLIWEGFRPDAAAVVSPSPSPLPRRIGTALALATTPAFLILGVAGTHDYLVWNRARWAAVDGLIRDSKVPPEKIDGGFEVANYFYYLPRINLRRAERLATLPPGQKDAIMAPDPIDPPFMIAVGPPSQPQHAVIARYPLSEWLPLAPREVLALKRVSPSAAAK